jgi:hypothetical protein
MRRDVSKVVFERQRRGSSEKSQKTRLKLNPGCDYFSGDFDWGVTHYSSARHRQEGHGNFSKSKNESYRSFHQFLRKSVGRLWDNVYSEICSVLDDRTYADNCVLRSLKWNVKQNIIMVDGVPYERIYGHFWPCNGLYIDPATGILCSGKSTKKKKVEKPITSLHWYDNVYFELEVLKRVAICGCVNFKPRAQIQEKRWRYYPPQLNVCFHGNEPVPKPIWYLIEYGYNKPDDIYKVYTYEKGLKQYGEAWCKTYNLNEPGDKYIVYYRDVPEQMEKPFIVRKKVANRKELKLIQKGIDNEQRMETEVETNGTGLQRPSVYRMPTHRIRLVARD